MELSKKKQLAARTLGVGASRVKFNTSRLSEIKEAITKQDIKDLVAQGAIIVKEIKGRTKTEKRSRRRTGSIKKKVKDDKSVYVRTVRKLRAHLQQLKKQGAISQDKFITLRKEIKSRKIQNKAQITEAMKE